MRRTQPNGFIFLEVLVAMSLILGVWLSSIGAYQAIVLRLITQETKRVELRKSFDAHEIQEQIRANLNNKDRNHESSRVPDRNRSVRHSAKSSVASKRTSGSKTD
jgi:type II secretory pathway component PulJ